MEYLLSDNQKKIINTLKKDRIKYKTTDRGGVEIDIQSMPKIKFVKVVDDIWTLDIDGYSAGDYFTTAGYELEEFIEICIKIYKSEYIIKKGFFGRTYLEVRLESERKFSFKKDDKYKFTASESK